MHSVVCKTNLIETFFLEMNISTLVNTTLFFAIEPDAYHCNDIKQEWLITNRENSRKGTGSTFVGQQLFDTTEMCLAQVWQNHETKKVTQWANVSIFFSNKWSVAGNQSVFFRLKRYIETFLRSPVRTTSFSAERIRPCFNAPNKRSWLSYLSLIVPRESSKNNLSWDDWPNFKKEKRSFGGLPRTNYRPLYWTMPLQS